MANVIKSETLDDALKIKSGIFEVDGKCSRCGGCCTRFLPITRGEEERIRRYIAKKHIPLRRDEDADVDMLCPFLRISEEGPTSCAIYPVRPKICRMWSCGGWTRKDKSFLITVGHKCAERPGLMNNYDMHSILGPAPDAENARMFLEIKKIKELEG